jgi:hypothetical protein
VVFLTFTYSFSSSFATQSTTTTVFNSSTTTTAVATAASTTTRSVLDGNIGNFFYGYGCIPRSHVDKNNMMWMQAMGKEREARLYGYPTGGQTRDNRDDWIAISGEVPYGTSGPFGTYDMTYCQDYSISYHYNGTRPEVEGMVPNRYEFLEGGPWLHGTTLDEVISEHFPFFDLYADYDGGDKDYTHKDIIEHSFPSRTDYTYDAMVKYFPNICTAAKDCPTLKK